MTIVDMLGQSGVMTLLGMGVVFAFLIIMVLCVSAMGKIIQKFSPDKDTSLAAVSASGPAKSAAVAAAITAAVNEYRKDN